MYFLIGSTFIMLLLIQVFMDDLLIKQSSQKPIAKKKNMQHQADKNYMDGFNLQKGMRDYQTNHLFSFPP